MCSNSTTLSGVLVTDLPEDSPDDDNDETRFTRGIIYARESLGDAIEKYSSIFFKVLGIVLFILYNVFLGFAIDHSWNKEDNFCEGVKFLTLITGITYFSLIYFHTKKYWVNSLDNLGQTKTAKKISRVYQHRYVQRALYSAVFIAAGIFLIIDTAEDRERLVSLLGLMTIIGLGFIFSKHPHKVKWRHVIWGVGLQFMFALMIIRWDVGRSIFECVGTKIAKFLGFTKIGSSFLFSFLVTGANVTVVDPKDSSLLSTVILNGGLAFQVLPVIIFFGFCISVLYYYGIMQWIVIKLGWLLEVSVGTTACESMNAAANVFLGGAEAPLMIKPYLKVMTKSELHAIMTGGFSTIAGGIMAAYINMGVSASHLLSASVMSAPAALAFSKLFYPETEKSKTTFSDIKIVKGTEKTVIEAAANGVVGSVPLIVNIIANLIAFLAVINFLDSVVQWLFSLIGWEFISFEWLLSKLFVPLAWVLGVDWSECDKVGKLIGLKTIVNEFVGYTNLVKMKSENLLSPRSEAIATYALCGFSNVASMGIAIGALGALVPERKSDLGEIAVRALISGSAACFMTASIAGLLVR